MTKTPQSLSDEELSTAKWRTSSWTGSGGDGNCVEVAPFDDGRVAVRHSHHRDGAVIVYNAAEWEAFIKGAQDGEFNF